jgi:hypothetical protein
VKSKSAITEISELEQILVDGNPEIAGKAEEITDEYLFEWNDEESVNRKEEKD